LEVRVYDNASGDETPEVVAELARQDARVKYHCHPTNIGAARNFLYGMERVDTPFFSFFQDDDVYLPDFYRNALAGFESYPEAICSVTAHLQVNGQGEVLAVPVAALKPGLYAPPEGMLAIVNSRVTWASCLIRREAIEKVGLLDLEAGDAGDLDFQLRMAAHFPMVVSHAVGTLGGSDDDTASASFRIELMVCYFDKMLRKLTQDGRIPAEVRISAGRALTERLQQIVFWRYGLRPLLRKNWSGADRAGAVLRTELHQPSRGLFLSTLAKLCKYVPPAYYAFLSARALRRSLPRRINRLDHRWGTYAKFLEI
jgi:glycosyltransferase involved in cell wall biosynthesis